MSAWQIPLQGVHPQFTDPLTAQQRGLSLQQLAGQVAIQRQMQAENNLKIQAAQEDQSDQQTIQGAFGDQSNWTDGKPDFDKIRTAIAPQVRLRNLQAFDQDHLRLQQAATSLAASQIQATRDKFLNIKNQYDLAGQLLAGVLAAPDEQKQDVYSSALTTLQKAGVDTSAYPGQVPDENTLKAYEAKLGYIGTLLTNADRQALEEQRKQKAARDEAQARKLQMEQDRADAATSHLAVDALDPEEQQAAHEAWLATLPDTIKAQYAGLKEYTPQTARTIQQMGLSGQQRQQAQQRETSTPMDIALQWAKAKYPEGTQDQIYDAALNRYSEMVKGEKFAPNAPGGAKEVQQRKEWLSNYDKATKEEQDNYGLLQRFGDAIDSGNVFLKETSDSKGGIRLTAVPMDTYTGADKKDENAAQNKVKAIEDMKARADAVRDQTKLAIQRKYNYAQRLGFGGNMGVDQAIAGLDAGRYNKAKTGTPAQAPAPVQSGQPPKAPTRAAPSQFQRKDLPDGRVQITLPGGKIKEFGSAKDADAFSAAAGLTWAK